VTIPGLDFAWSKPSVAAIQAGGYKFVLRYHSYDTTGKNLTKAEADSYKAAGIDICSNWEYATDAALNGFNQGVQDAIAANNQMLACGGDPTAPIYFSVDFDATEAQQAPINDYLRGIASVIGLSRTGMYAGYWPLSRAFNAGLLKWGWQTYAWSGGNWDPRAQLRQVQNGITVGGADCDEDQAQVSNYGQWFYNGGGNERIEDMPAIVAHDPAGSLVVVWTTNEGMVWENIQRPETEAAWLAACGGGPRAEVPNVADLCPNYADMNATRDAQQAAALAKALKDAGVGTGTGGGGTSPVDHTHDLPAGVTGPATPTP
jgi:glycoside hydrolase-like protein